MPRGKFSLADFEHEVTRTQFRLIESGLFYSVSVHVIPPRTKPAERAIVITVTQGFLHRFSGGDAFAVYGREALQGSRSSLYFYAGWNLFGIDYASENLFSRGIILGASIFSHDLLPSLFDKNEDRPRTDVSVWMGKYLTPDISITLGPGIHLDTMSSESIREPLFYLNPAFHISRLEFFPFKYQWTMDTNGAWYPTENIIRVETLYTTHKDFGPVCLAFAASGGNEPDDSPEIIAFNLYDTDNRSVRSGYSKETLTVTAFGLYSMELRFNIFELKIPPSFIGATQIFIFTDGAWIQPHAPTVAKQFVDAYGCGFRIAFDNPIFASFTFSYGVSHEGNSRFIFSATGGY